MKKYTGKQAPDVARIVNDNPFAVFRSDPFEFYPVRMMNGDGIPAPGAGFWTAYISSRRAGVVCACYLISVMTDNEFYMQEA